MPVTCFCYRPLLAKGRKVKILVGLSLKGYVERVREVPAQEDYVIPALLALV